MAIIRQWSGDGVSPGTLTTSSAGAGDNSFSQVNGSSLTIEASGVRSPRLKLTQAANTVCSTQWDFAAQSTVGLRFYWNSPAAWPASSFSIAKIGDGNTSSPLNINVMTNGSLRMVVPGGIQVAASGSGTINLGTRYRIEVKLTQNGTSGLAELKIFAGDGTTAISTISATADYGTQHTTVLFGNNSTTPTVDTQYYDDMAVANTATFIGPKAAGGGNSAPTANAGANKNVVAGQTVTLTGSGSDSDGTISSYAWTQVSGPTVSVQTGGSQAPNSATINANAVTVADPDTSGVLNENSGLVVSQKNSTSSGRVFWGHNDSGGAATVYAFDDQSPYTILGAYTLGGTTNQDWEDIALGPGPDSAKSYLYVGNIGSSAGTMRIHRIEEPNVSVNQTAVTATIASGSVDTFTMTRPSGTNDCEGFFVDPVTGDIFFFQKNNSTSRPHTANAYRIAASQLGLGSRTVTPTLLGSFRSHDQTTNNGGITGADISEDGRFFAICNYQEIWLWIRDVANGQTVAQALLSDPVGPYYQMPNSWGTESIAFDTGALPGRLYGLSEGVNSTLKYVPLTITTSSSGGQMASFTAPYRTTDSTLGFELTVTDNNGATGTDMVNVSIAKHRRWMQLSDRLAPLIRNPQSAPDPVTGSVSSTTNDGSVTLTWNINPGGHSVSGVYVGRGGTDSNGSGPWETLKTTLTGTQTFNNLVNGTTYTLYAQPVVDGVRGDRYEATVTPTGAAPQPTAAHLLGIYHGGPLTDDDVQTRFGAYPDMASTYYQQNQNTISITNETARINKGITPLLTITTKQTQRLDGIAKGVQADLDWLDVYINRLDTLSKVDPSIKIYATIEHEHDVKKQQGELTGNSAQPAVLGAVLSVFARRCRANAPNVLVGYWYGGFQTAHILSVYQNITEPIDWVSMDPYVNGNTYESATQNFQPEVNRIRNSAGIYNTEWIRLGQPAIGISEHGISKYRPSTGTVVHSDQAMANYYTNMRSVLVNLDIRFAVFFNRDSGPNGHHNITDGAHPLAVAAFSNSLQA